MDYDLNKFIEFRPKRDGRMRPFVKGTRVEVQYIVTDNEVHNMDPEEIAEGYPLVSLAVIYAALAFYHDNREEVRQMIREDDAIAKLHLRDNGNHVTGQGSHDGASSASP